MAIDIVGRVEGAEDLLRGLQSAPRVVKDGVWASIRKISLAVMRRIKTEMPVDTGRARASWGIWTPGDVRDNRDASDSDAVWEEDRAGQTLTQGTNVPYVARLNDGWSQQAPKGFIDKAANAGARLLVEEIERILGRL